MRKNGKTLFIFVLGLVFCLNISTVFVTSSPAAEQVVVANWGGESALGEKACFYDPFEKETGIKVIMVSPPQTAKIKAQVDSGNIEWDVIMTDIPAIITLTEGEKVYLEELDYSKLDQNVLAEIIPETKRKYSIGAKMYSFNICYNANKFQTDHPRTWADVWDVKKFPGTRSFNDASGGITPQYAIWLLADGVPMDKVYPIDIDRAYRSISKLKPYITKWYTGHAQAIQMLASGEIDIACTIGPRAISAKWKGAPIGVEYNQGKLASDNWCIIKGAKNREAAYKLINYILDAKRQACFATKVPYGPSNMKASSYLDTKIASDLNTSPKNLAGQFWENVKWWVEVGQDGKTNRDRELERYSKWLTE